MTEIQEYKLHVRRELIFEILRESLAYPSLDLVKEKILYPMLEEINNSLKESQSKCLD